MFILSLLQKEVKKNDLFLVAFVFDVNPAVKTTEAFHLAGR